MRWLDKLKLRWRSLVRPAEEERRVERELAFHLAQQIDENISKGLPPEEARRAALELMGALPRWKEECRDMRRVHYVADFLQDIRYGVRMIRKAPLFAFVAVLTLALGIGANTAIYSFIDALLFRPPMASDPAGLVSVFTMGVRDRRGPSSLPDFRLLERSSRKLTQWTAYTSTPLLWAGAEKSEIVWGNAATGGYFETFGIAPLLGRAFGPQDAFQPVAVLGNRFWHDRMRSDPAALGRPLSLGGRVYTVIGVMPEHFRGNSPTFEPALWIPFDAWAAVNMTDWNKPGRQSLDIAARLAPGVSSTQARAEVAALSLRLEPDPDKPLAHRTITTLTYREARLSQDRTFAFIAAILFAVVGVVLLIAASNVAGLLITRTLARRREIAVRMSIGASRGRIVRQLLTESIVLGVLGAVAGAMAASWALALLRAYQFPSPMPILLDARLDTRAIVFAPSIGFLSSILFGLMAAREAARSHIAANIRQPRARRGMDALVGLQVAGGVVLISGALLFLAALNRAESINPGFQPDHALAMTIDPGLLGYKPEQTAALYDELLQRVRSIPGVREAGLAQNIPLGFGIPSAEIRRAESGVESPLAAKYNVIAGDFFPAMGTRLLRGRAFLVTDSAAAPPVAIVNEFMARTLFPGRDAIGAKICVAGTTSGCPQIVGIAEQGKYGTLAEDPSPHFWLPLSQRFTSRMILLIRTDGDPLAFVSALRKEAAALAPNLPILEIKTLREHMRIPLLEPQLPTFFLTVLSAIGLLLSLAGIFAVTSYAVTSRTREIGIRMAVGASRYDVLALLIGKGLTVVGIATCAGLVVSAFFGKFVSPLLYGLNPVDPLRLGAVGALMIAAMLAGILWPARAAMRVDPAVTLREQ